MKINKITTNNYSFKSNYNDKSETTYSHKIPTSKTAKAILAALAMLSTYAQAEVIDIKKAAFDYAQKEYARLKQYDTNNDGLLDEKEQSKLVQKANNNIKKSSQITKEKVKLAQKLVHLLHGRNEDGSKPKKTFWGVPERRNYLKAINYVLNKATIEELIELNAISNNLIIEELYKNNADPWSPWSQGLEELNNRLITYRLNNLPANFTPIPNFRKDSGLFNEIIDEGIFSDTHTGKYKLAGRFDFDKNVAYLCKNPRIKEKYADNFVYVLHSIKNAKHHSLYVDQVTLNKLLLPEYNINK